MIFDIIKKAFHSFSLQRVSGCMCVCVRILNILVLVDQCVLYLHLFYRNTSTYIINKMEASSVERDAGKTYLSRYLCDILKSLKVSFILPIWRSSW